MLLYSRDVVCCMCLEQVVLPYSREVVSCVCLD